MERARTTAESALHRSWWRRPTISCRDARLAGAALADEQAWYGLHTARFTPLG